MGNVSDKHIKKLTHKELKHIYRECLLISIYTELHDVIKGTVFVNEEDYYIDKALKEKKKIVFYGFDEKDIYYYKCIYEVYAPVIGYDCLYFYENGLKEWLIFHHIYGNDEYPIYRYV